MSFNTLVALRAQIDQLIGKRVKKEAKFYRKKLAELAGFDGGRPAKKAKKVDARKRKRAKAKIKYRGPKPTEKWSGRGMTPRWMQAYIKAGKKRESFLVR